WRVTRLGVGRGGLRRRRPPFERDEPDLVEPPDRDGRERLPGEIRERLAAPEAEGLAQQLDSRLLLASAEFGPGVFGQSFELREVELLRLEPGHIAGGARLDRRRRAPALSPPPALRLCPRGRA